MDMYVRAFCREHTYPAEAEEALLAALAAVDGTPMGDALARGVADYEEKGVATDMWEALSALREAPPPEGVSRYTVLLLYFILCSQHLWDIYQERGIGYRVYFDSMEDLKCKLQECHTVHGVWGTFVSGWFPGFFTLERFALGRLQYEEMAISAMSSAVNTGRDSFTVDGHELKLTDKVINVHIPSAGPLLPEDVAASFRQATAFFADRFHEYVPFMCSSWLLYSRHREFLPATSRILRFMDFFTIVADREEEDGHNLWRIFGTDEQTQLKDMDLTALPVDTGLRRAYHAWLTAGNLPGAGLAFRVEPIKE